MWPVMLEFGSGVAVAFLVSLAGCRALMLAGPLDHPGDARKVQTRPIPTSGGLAIGLGFALGLLVLSFLSESWRGVLKGEGVSPLSPSAGCAFVFLMIGFFDDARPISAWIKLILFSAVSLAASYLIGVIDVLPFGAGLELRLPFAIGLFGTALWVFVLVNCVNFMDGANGLAMGSAAIGLLGLAAIATDLGSASGAAICLCCAGALAGFLVWNVPNGALFAGDSGALFAGSVGAFASLLVMRETGLTPFVPPLLFLPLLADALLTLARGARPLAVGWPFRTRLSDRLARELDPQARGFCLLGRDRGLRRHRLRRRPRSDPAFTGDCARRHGGARDGGFLGGAQARRRHGYC